MKLSSALAIALLALLALLVAAASAGLADTCSLSLALAPAEREVSMVPDDDEGVIFQGSFSVTAAPEIPSEVRFEATVSTGWVAEVTPASVAFESAEESSGTLNVTVLVPAGAPASQTALVSLAGRASNGALVCGEGLAQVRVTPLPYFGPVTIRPSPQPADVDPVTGFATVDLRLTSQTNFPGQVLARLTVRPSDGLTHDAPQDVALSPAGSGAVEGLVTVHFFPPGSTPHTYTITVFADVLQTNQTGGVAHFFRTTIQVRVLPQPMNGAVVALTAVGALLTLGAAVWVWQATRPGRR